MNVFVVVVAYLAFAAAAAAVAPAEAESAADDEAARSVVCFSKQQVALLLLRRRGQGIDVQLLSPMVIVIVTFVVVRLVGRSSQAMMRRMRKNYRRYQ